MIWGNRNFCNFRCLRGMWTEIGNQILPAYRINILEIVNSVSNTEMFEFDITAWSFTVSVGSLLPGMHQVC